MLRILFIVLPSITLPVFNSYSQQRDIILDADTGNEMDDLYAVVRMVLEETVNVI